MYSVSESYKLAMNRPIQKRRIRGTIGDVPFTEYDILDDSLKITNQFTESSKIALGGVYVGQIELTFLSTVNIPRGSWNNKKIVLSDELLIDEAEDIWEAVPLGEYTISEATWSAEGISVTAYDNMSKFDKACSLSTTSGKPFNLLMLASKDCKVDLGITSEELEQFPNGSEELALYPENDIDTWRDFISWIAQALCAFATIDRDGHLTIKPIGITSVNTIRPNRRFEGATFSDFSTFYTGMSVVNMENQTTSYYSVDPDDGLTMNLGSNPFLQYGLAETLKKQREAILTQLASFDCVPFTAQMLNDPAYDLGDIIVFEDGIAGNASNGCIMQYEYTFGNSYSCAGFGEDPSLASAQSKTEKDISGLSSRVDSANFYYFKYTNAEDIQIGEAFEKIASIRFAAIKDTNVDVWHEFKIHTSKTEESDRIVATVNYYLNGELIAYEPIETWAIDGYHILGLKYHLANVSSERQNVWEVFINISGGSGTISAGDGTVVLGGQGMEAKEEWNGLIEIDQRISRYGIVALNSIPFRDEVSLNFIVDSRYSFRESIPEEDISSLINLPMSANCYISLALIDYFNMMASPSEIYSGSDIGLL